MNSYEKSPLMSVGELIGSVLIGLALGAILLYSCLGCTPAAMNGFTRGLAGYPPPPIQQPVFTPIQNRTVNTYGTIYGPNGQTYQYNSTTR